MNYHFNAIITFLKPFDSFNQRKVPSTHADVYKIFYLLLNEQTLML